MARYGVRYGAGVICLTTATLLSLLIPRTVQRAVEALERDPAVAPIAGFAGLILLIALGNGVARLASRFLIVGSAQRVESDIRNELYRSLAQFPPDFYARHAIVDLMARASSDVGARQLLQPDCAGHCIAQGEPAGGGEITAGKSRRVGSGSKRRRKPARVAVADRRTGG